MSRSLKKADAVFEGGGVKGIGLAGAVAVTEEAGYQFENVAGTSAGAIVAALALYQAGCEAAATFFGQWDFDNYVAKYRTENLLSGTEP